MNKSQELTRNASEDVLSVRGRAIGTPSRSRKDLSEHGDSEAANQVGMVPHSLSIKQNKKLGIHERPPWKPTNKAATRDGADLNDHIRSESKGSRPQRSRDTSNGPASDYNQQTH